MTKRTKIIAIANQKGGVGKTTTVVNLAAALARRNRTVLVVDLDPQANATGGLGLEKEEGVSIYPVLLGNAEIADVIQPTAYNNLNIIPSEVDLAGAEIEIARREDHLSVIRDALAPVRESGVFDYILLDCPPSLGLLTVNAFVASDEIIIPLTAEALPFQGLTMIGKIIGMVQKRLNTSLRLSGILFTRWEGRKLNKLVEEAVRGKYGDIVYNSRVRTNIALAEAPLSKLDILSYNDKSNGAQDYIEVADELLRRTGSK
jgi:chromosome partitioning protein